MDNDSFLLVAAASGDFIAGGELLFFRSRLCFLLCEYLRLILKVIGGEIKSEYIHSLTKALQFPAYKNNLVALVAYQQRKLQIHHQMNKAQAQYSMNKILKYYLKLGNKCKSIRLKPV